MKERKPQIDNVYRGVVKPEGNVKAQELMYKYFEFEKADVNWKGIGNIPKSGLELRSEYFYLNAKVVFKLPEIKEEKVSGCICSRVVLGKAYPSDCKLFKTVCTPIWYLWNIRYRFGKNGSEQV